VCIAQTSIKFVCVAGTDGHNCRPDHHAEQDRGDSDAQLPASGRCQAEKAEFRVNVVGGRHCELLIPAPAFNTAVTSFPAGPLQHSGLTQVQAIFVDFLSSIYWAMVDLDSPIRSVLVLWLSCTAWPLTTLLA
jgi:hypothetical protein